MEKVEGNSEFIVQNSPTYDLPPTTYRIHNSEFSIASTPPTTLAYRVPRVKRHGVAPDSRIRLSKAVDTGFGAREVSADGPCRA